MKEFVCIVCPNSCDLKIDEKNFTVTGNKCVRGESFAINEIKDPKRTICTTVKTSFVDCPVIPVKTSGEIPKSKIFDVMKEINKVIISDKLGIGDVVINNVLNLDVDIIVTSNKLKRGI